LKRSLFKIAGPGFVVHFRVAISPFVWDLVIGIWSLLPLAVSMAENNPGELNDRHFAARIRVEREENL